MYHITVRLLIVHSLTVLFKVLFFTRPNAQVSLRFYVRLLIKLLYTHLSYDTVWSISLMFLIVCIVLVMITRKVTIHSLTSMIFFYKDLRSRYIIGGALV